MASHSNTLPRAAWVLYAGLLGILVLFGVPMRYGDTGHALIALTGIAIITGASLALGGAALLHGSEETRRLAITGMLLVAPWAVFAVMAGYGPPWTATGAQNHLRYKGLLINVILVGGGLCMLKEVLAAAGERLWSAMGQISALVGTLAYLVWGAVIMGAYLARDHARPGMIALEMSPLGPASEILLFYGSLLTYLATAAFAISLHRLGWIGPRSARTYVALSLVAVVALAARGFEYPDANEQWYLMPGFIVGIPAVPWIMPFLLGVLCLGSATHGRREAVVPAARA